MIPFALNAAAITGISTIQMKLNFPLMERVIILLSVVVTIAEIIGGNAMSLNMLLRRSGMINAFVAQGHDYCSPT